MDDDREDLPANWRSVVDPNTGRTYWYHRKTRISTWTKPACLNDISAPSNPPPAKSESKQAKVDAKPVSSKPTQSVPQPQQHQQPKQQLSLSESIDRSLANNDNANLQLLMSYIKPINVKAVASQRSLISSLVNIIIQTKLTAARQAGLRCLWSLSRDRKCVAINFHANQSWVSLANQYHKWEDVESVLLLSACLSNLLVGRATYSLVTSNMKEALVGYLSRICETTDLAAKSSGDGTAVNVELFLSTSADASSSESAEPLVSAASLQLYSVLISNGHSLPALLVLVLIAQSFRIERWFVSLVKVGAVGVLQSICTSPLMDASIKDKARQCLLLAMTRSAHVRESILDSLLDVTSDLTSIPLAMGPDPALFNNISSSIANNSDDAARQSEIDQGWFEITQELREGEELPHYLNRDVEWIPLNGTAWALSSSLLWCRCPALREVIDAFWTEGGAGLELSIDASDDTLACLVKYVHSGLLLLPATLQRQLELLRVSSELDMLPLYLAVESGIKQNMTSANVAQVIEFARTQEFPDLEDTAKAFIRGGAQPFEVIRFDDLSSDRAGLRGAGSGHSNSSGSLKINSAGVERLNENSSNASLRDAIFASLQDVAEVFVGGTNVDPTKPSSPLSKNQLLQAAAAAKLVKTLQIDHQNEQRGGGSSLQHQHSYEDYHNISMEDILQDRFTSVGAGGATEPLQQQQRQQTPQKAVVSQASHTTSGSSTAASSASVVASSQQSQRASLLPQPVARKQHSYREEDLAEPTEQLHEEQRESDMYGEGDEDEDYEMMQSTDYYTGDTYRDLNDADVSRMTMDQSVEYDPSDSVYRGSSYSSQYRASGSGGGAAARSGSGAPKSGGIYGLLLKESKTAGGVPGRVPVESGSNNRRSTNSGGGGFGSSASTDRNPTAKKTGGGTKSDTSATPRTARATSLLAGARPSGGNSYLATYQEEESYNRLAGASIDGYNSGEEVGDFNGAREFDKQMSLAPMKELTERERKLIEMSKPRQSVPKKKPSTKPTKETAAADEEGEVTVDEPSLDIISAETPTTTSAAAAPAAGSSNAKKLQPTAPAGAPKKASTQPPGEETAATVTARALPGLAVPKRATSPAPQVTQESMEEARREQAAFNSANSLDDHSSSSLATPGSAVSPVNHHIVVDAVTAPNPAAMSQFMVDPNVRGSLTLLKNKTGGIGRRRRSVADVDVSSGGGDDYSSGSNTPTPHSAGAASAGGMFSAGPAASSSASGGGVAVGGTKVVSVDLSAMMTSDSSSTTTAAVAAVSVVSKPPARKPMSLSSLMSLNQAAASTTRQEIADARAGPSPTPAQIPASNNARSSNNYNHEDDDDDEYQVDSYQQQQRHKQQQPSQSSSQRGGSSSRSSYGDYDDNDDAYGSSAAAVNDDPYGDADGGERLTCPDCGRQFAEAPYQKHVNICAKVFLNKRKAFDSAKMRMEAIPELQELQQQQSKQKGRKGAASAAGAKMANENTLNTNNSGGAAAAAASNGGKWKEQSNAFREAMKAARQYKQAVETGAPLPPVQLSAPDPSLIQCPHCSRRFNEKAAERHISHCQTAKNKPSTLKKGSGVNAASGTANVAAQGASKSQVKGGVKW